MTKDRGTHLQASHVRRAVCGEYTTTVLDTVVPKHLCLKVQLRLALWRLSRTLHVASLQGLRNDACRVGPVERNERRAVEA